MLPAMMAAEALGKVAESAGGGPASASSTLTFGNITGPNVGANMFQTMSTEKMAIAALVAIALAGLAVVVLKKKG